MMAGVFPRNRAEPAVVVAAVAVAYLLAAARVLAGNGPCNRARMAARRQAHADGQWVRDAMIAYADKQRLRQAGEAA